MGKNGRPGLWDDENLQDNVPDKVKNALGTEKGTFIDAWKYISKNGTEKEKSFINNLISSQTLRKDTKKQYLYYFARFLTYAIQKNTNILDLDAGEFLNFFEKLGTSGAGSLSVIRKYFSFLKNEDKLEMLKDLGNYIRKPEMRELFLPPDEIKRILSEKPTRMKADRFEIAKSVILTLCYTGARNAEFMSPNTRILQKEEQRRFDYPVLMIDSAKIREREQVLERQRLIPILDWAYPFIEKAISWKNEINETLKGQDFRFLKMRLNSLLSPIRANYYNKIGVMDKTDVLYPHAIRHSFITNQLEAFKKHEIGHNYYISLSYLVGWKKGIVPASGIDIFLTYSHNIYDKETVKLFTDYHWLKEFKVV